MRWTRRTPIYHWPYQRTAADAEVAGAVAAAAGHSGEIAIAARLVRVYRLPRPSTRLRGPLTVLLTLAYFSLTLFTPLVCEGVDPAWLVAVTVQV